MTNKIKEDNGDFFVELNNIDSNTESTNSEDLILNESQIILLSKISTLDFLDFYGKIELAEQIKKICDEEILKEINREIDFQQEKFDKIIIKEEKRLYYLEKRTFGI